MLVPAILDLSLKALLVKNVLAADLNNRLLSKSLNIADDAIRVSILSQRLALIFGNTIFMQTRRMFLFMSCAIAWMAAFKECSAASP